MNNRLSLAAICASVALLFSAELAAAPVVFAIGGSDAASIQTTVDEFRTSLGTLNPNVAGSFGSGRREINWDGVPDAFAAPNNLPPDFFNVNTPRGVIFSTPGVGVQVSANVASGVPIEFGNIDPSYSGLFSTFSAPRLFTGLGSNVVDVNFFVPGSNTAALTTGFGAVFTDVDLADTTSIEFFDAANSSLGTFFAPPGTTSNESLSFLGVDFDENVISRVRITSGNASLGAGILETPDLDLVVMDDFIYGEPVAAAAVPEAATLTLLGLGLLGMGMTRRKSKKA